MRKALLALVGVAALALTACGSADGSPGTASPTTTRPPRVLAFGTPLELAPGAVVTVGAPRVHDVQHEYGPSVADRLLQFPVTVTNRGTGALPVAGVVLTVTYDGSPAGAVTVLDEPPEVTAPGARTMLLPGQTTSYDELYRLPRPAADVVVAVSDGPDGPPAFYRGAAPSPPPPATPSTTPSTTTPLTTTPPTTAATSSPGSDPGSGCGPRAVSRGEFDPDCPEYQGYLDPGLAGGRGPSSGDIQREYACEEGLIPAEEC